MENGENEAIILPSKTNMKMTQREIFITKGGFLDVNADYEPNVETDLQMTRNDEKFT